MAEIPAIVGIPVILRALLGFFHQLFQQHVPPLIGPLKRRGEMPRLIQHTAKAFRFASGRPRPQPPPPRRPLTRPSATLSHEGRG
ncbi:hypothetical protein Gura_3549 [Geotalea uraniireducens Rf4]|uniref:Uncharacterized protein n=1 Tax=Geotalea uraniireducens (strain Rf4) TaxID=351605 RepID=A5G7D6_GEOUR|nr:hypothetical protein Gura_3549 [Geotalea uraniireducens Rf4]